MATYFHLIKGLVKTVAESCPVDSEYGNCYFCDSESGHTAKCPVTIAKKLISDGVV
jgi:hypothetical protein